MGAKRLIIVPIVVIVSLVGSLSFFYSGRYVPPKTPPPSAAGKVPQAYVSSAFVDSPGKQTGTLVIDESHFNSFSEQEIAILLSRVTARGYEIKTIGSLSTFMGSDARLKEREALLEDGLRVANSFLVALPWNEYTTRERELVRNFVDRGGRLLLIGEPTRRNTINQIAQDYSIIFANDYLYNVKEHEDNFRYIYLRDFAPGEITRGLKTVVFYVASSLSLENGGLVFTDSNTFSSTRELTGRFSPVVQAANGNVLAISDLTFMSPPYNSVMDNDRFISNIADYLTGSGRVFKLSEFPHFFGSQVDVIVGREELLSSAQSLASLVNQRNRTAELKERENYLQETVFLGLWEDANQVGHYLTGAGIQVDKTIVTPFSQKTQTQGTALILLQENQGRHILIILGDSRDTVKEAVARLKSGEFRQGLVSDNLGVYTITEAVPQRAAGGTTPAPVKGGNGS